MPANAIAIVACDAAWEPAFAAEAERIRDALGQQALRVDHVGSTSVPGLPAKPVSDIQLSVERLHPMDGWRARLESIGYAHVLHPDDVHYPFLHRPVAWPYTHHIHVCAVGSQTERNHLAFRDFLREHPDSAREYAGLKYRLAAHHSAASFESRNAYSEAKSSFIEPIIERALAAGYPRESLSR